LIAHRFQRRAAKMVDDEMVDSRFICRFGVERFDLKNAEIIDYLLLIIDYSIAILCITVDSQNEDNN